MDTYQTEDEQVEALKKWWEENGKSAIFGVVLGFMAIFGWREWKDYEVEQAAAASQLYQEMIIASRDEKAETVREKAVDIVSSYKSTGYAIFAKLCLAKVAVAEGKLEEAEEYLQWVLDNASQDSILHVVRLRLSDVLIAQNKLAEAKALLAKASKRGEFVASYLELEGDVLRLEGNTVAALDSYQKALTKAQESGQDVAILNMKLDDLGHNTSL